MKYPCGCINEVDAESGVLHCIHKCEHHVEFLKNQSHDSFEYYHSLGCIKNGIPQNKNYIVEFKKAFKELNATSYIYETSGGWALEIGCGIGMYVPMFLKHDWEYTGIETSQYAAEFTHMNHDVYVEVVPFEAFDLLSSFHLILAAHVVEHMKRAPAMLQKMYYRLRDGGMLYLIVPDDTDQTNPDHWWFFTVATLHALLEKIGFKNVRSTVRKIVAHENFIYCVAEK